MSSRPERDETGDMDAAAREREATWQPRGPGGTTLSRRDDALATFCESRAQGKRACIERESESKDREEREGVRKGKQCTGEEKEEGRSFYD